MLQKSVDIYGDAKLGGLKSFLTIPAPGRLQNNLIGQLLMSTINDVTWYGAIEKNVNDC